MSNIEVNHLARIKELSTLLETSGFATTTELVSRFRSEKALLNELPSVFEGTMESILERLESAAMFSEEACSFSQTDMVAVLKVWLDKSDSYLRKQMGIVD